MDEIRLGAVELKFAEIVWANAPIPSGELVKICKKELDWSKSTTYTVLRRLCERGLLKNENGVVDVLVGENEYYTQKSNAVVNTDFGGSLPAFVAAFTAGKGLTENELDELQTLIDGFRRGQNDA